MYGIFISYKHVAPDQDLTHFIAQALQERGHHVFVDTQMLVGTRWVEEIERQLRAADFFVVLLSSESIRSEMVRWEVKLAHQLVRQEKKQFTILPIRVAFEGELPQDIGAYLDPIQYAFWRLGDPYEVVSTQLIAAIEQSVALPKRGRADDEEPSASGMLNLFHATEARGAPLPGADPRFLEVDTGSVKLDSPFYIRREADARILRLIRTQGTTTVVKGARQMGKSSLLARVHAEARRIYQKSCYLDFQLLDDAILTSLDTLLRYLARRIARTFKLSVRPDDYWDEFLGPKDNLTDFIADAILSEATLPVVLVFDEADRVFHFPYRDDFFATIRGWHNLRATEDSWNYLNLVIAHSTEPYLWIQDIHQSPFNVGAPIWLDNFDFAQVAELNARHGSPLKTDRDIQDLMHLVGGQPYLVQQAFYTLAINRWTMAQLQKVAPSETGPFADHLRGHLWLLQEHKELKSVMQRVLRDGVCEEELHFQRLKAAGLVEGTTRHALQIRCQLYEIYFNSRL